MLKKLINKNTANNTINWKKIGIVSSETSLKKTHFFLRERMGKLGDFVVIKTEKPNSNQEKETMLVWGMISEIKRVNPTLIADASQELAEADIDLSDTIMSLGKEVIEAEIKILGYSDTDVSGPINVSPLSYSIKPGASVYLPDKNSIENFLFPNNVECTFRIGSPMARKDISLVFDGQALNKHVFVTMTTGKGKTEAIKTIIKSLSKYGWPIIIFDPHGEYVGLSKTIKKYYPAINVKNFYPKFSINNKEEIFLHIQKLGLGLTDPQEDFLENLIERMPYKNDMTFKKYAEQLISSCTQQIENSERRSVIPTIRVVRRCLRKVEKEIKSMEEENSLNRKRLPDLEFEEMPDPFTDPDMLVNKNQISIIFLAGYRDRTQSVIASLLLETLFNHLMKGNKNVPPFVAVLEEAQRFCPSSKMSKNTEDLPSLHTIRRIVQEGRKFGAGLIISSQSPSQIDAITLAQCNTFMVGHLSNSNDISWLSKIMENWDDTCSKMIPNFGIGQAIISGPAVKFPLPIKIDYFPELENKFGGENHYEKIKNWSNEKIKSSNEKLKNNDEINKIIELDTRKKN